MLTQTFVPLNMALTAPAATINGLLIDETWILGDAGTPANVIHDINYFGTWDDTFYTAY